MAFTRKWLAAMGIDADKIDEIVAAHMEIVDSLKAERDGYRTEAEKAKKDSEGIEALRREKNELAEKAGKYDALKAEYDGYKTDVNAREMKAKKSAAYRTMLEKIGVSAKRIPAVLKLTDLNALKLNEDGTLADAGAQEEAAKKEWADFIGTTRREGADVETPPGGDGSGDKSRASEIAASYYANQYGEEGNSKK